MRTFHDNQSARWPSESKTGLLVRLRGSEGSCKNLLLAGVSHTDKAQSTRATALVERAAIRFSTLMLGAEGIGAKWRQP